MEILLLRNYYSSLTASAIGNTNVTEDVSPNLSARYSRRPNGEYYLAFFPTDLLNTYTGCNFYYGNYIPSSNIRFVGFGNNTNQPTFEDYAPGGLVKGTLSANRTSNNTVYDANTKTYTLTETYTLTNNTDNIIEVNEILYGGSGYSISDSGRSAAIYVTRDLLNENSFSIGAKESVKFELTIKYTIAEPLQ